jgi:hypothetical protein
LVYELSQIQLQRKSHPAMIQLYFTFRSVWTCEHQCTCYSGLHNCDIHLYSWFNCWLLRMRTSKSRATTTNAWGKQRYLNWRYMQLSLRDFRLWSRYNNIWFKCWLDWRLQGSYFHIKKCMVSLFVSSLMIQAREWLF